MMDSVLLIKNGRVIDPANGIDRTCDVLIINERIQKVGDVAEQAHVLLHRFLILIQHDVAQHDKTGLGSPYRAVATSAIA